MVPKQCPRLRPIIWYLFCCARCLGSQDIVQNHTHIHTYIHTHIHDPAPSFIGHRLFDSGFAPAALSLRLNNQHIVETTPAAVTDVFGEGLPFVADSGRPGEWVGTPQPPPTPRATAAAP